MNSSHALVKPETTDMGILTIWAHIHTLWWKKCTIFERKIILKPGDIREMYHPISGPILAETIERLAGRPLRLFTVQADDDVITKLASLRGHHMDPARCAIGTLRKILSGMIPVVPKQLDGGHVYYPNFVHIPKNEAESNICRRVFKSNHVEHG